MVRKIKNGITYCDCNFIRRSFSSCIISIFQCYIYVRPLHIIVRNGLLLEIELPLLHSAVGRRSVSTMSLQSPFPSLWLELNAEFAVKLIITTNFEVLVFSCCWNCLQHQPCFVSNRTFYNFGQQSTSESLLRYSP